MARRRCCRVAQCIRLTGIAQSRSISESAQLISARGFTVIDEDIEDHLFEFEAIKNNQKWKLKKRS